MIENTGDLIETLYALLTQETSMVKQHSESVLKAMQSTINAVAVKLQGYDHHFMVVVKGFGKEPMMLPGSCEANPGRKESVWRIVE